MKALYAWLRPHRLTLYEVDNTYRLVLRANFDYTESGIEGFSLWISKEANRVFYVILDGFKESFHLENMPNVGWSDQRAIIYRRFDQLSRDSVFRYARRHTPWFGGLKEGRIKYVLSVIPEHATIDRWLDSIEKHKLPLMGIYSISSLIGAFSARNKNMSEQCYIVMAKDEYHGLRQCVFINRKLMFYRLHPEPKGKWTKESCFAEIQRSSRYFSMSLNISIDQLNFVYLNFGRDDYLAELFNDSYQKIVSVQTPIGYFGQAIWKGISVKESNFSQFSDYMILWLAISNKSNQYAPLTRLYYRGLYLFQKRLIGFMRIFILFCFVLIAVFILLSYKFEEEKKDISLLNLNTESQIFEIEKKLGSSAEEMLVRHEVVNYFSALKNQPRAHHDILRLSDLFKQLRNPVKITDFKWKKITQKTGSDNLLTCCHVQISISGTVDFSLGGEEYLTKDTEFYEWVKKHLAKQFKIESFVSGQTKQGGHYLRHRPSLGIYQFDLTFVYSEVLS